MTAFKITPAIASLLSSCLQIGVEEAPDEEIEAAGGEEELEKVHELIGELRSWAAGGIDGVLLIEGARYHAYCQEAKAKAATADPMPKTSEAFGDAVTRLLTKRDR